MKSLSRLTLRNSMGCSPPGSSVHGIVQVKALEWGAIAFSSTLWEVIKLSPVAALPFYISTNIEKDSNISLSLSKLISHSFCFCFCFFNNSYPNGYEVKTHFGFDLISDFFQTRSPFVFFFFSVYVPCIFFHVVLILGGCLFIIIVFFLNDWYFYPIQKYPTLYVVTF